MHSPDARCRSLYRPGINIQTGKLCVPRSFFTRRLPPDTPLSSIAESISATIDAPAAVPSPTVTTKSGVVVDRASSFTTYLPLFSFSKVREPHDSASSRRDRHNARRARKIRIRRSVPEMMKVHADIRAVRDPEQDRQRSNTFRPYSSAHQRASASGMRFR